MYYSVKQSPGSKCLSPLIILSSAVLVLLFLRFGLSGQFTEFVLAAPAPLVLLWDFFDAALRISFKGCQMVSGVGRPPTSEMSHCLAPPVGSKRRDV